MIALAYFNQRPGAMLDGFVDGDELQPTWLPPYEIAGRDTIDAADHVFAILNRDERPNGQTERSLSVGDVVRVDVPAEHEGGTGYRVWLACDAVGWRTIEVPLEADDG
jgi:hypothetical protein